MVKIWLQDGRHVNEELLLRSVWAHEDYFLRHVDIAAVENEMPKSRKSDAFLSLANHHVLMELESALLSNGKEPWQKYRGRSLQI